jgi:hypothetical protein
MQLKKAMNLITHHSRIGHTALGAQRHFEEACSADNLLRRFVIAKTLSEITEERENN